MKKKITTPERIKAFRKLKGISQSELSEKSGLSALTIIRLESGRNSPTISTLEKVAKVFGITVKELIS